MNALSFLLLGVLAAGLVTAAVLDWRSRRIPNWLTGAVLAGAPVLWIADALPLWPAIALRLAVALAVLAVLVLLFIANAMGGGDVKLLATLVLWFGPAAAWGVLMGTAIGGGVLTAAMLVRQRWRPAGETLEVPYGIAIAGAGLWAVAERYLHQFSG